MNPHIASRLERIHNVLYSAFEGGEPLSSSSKGHERETFISLFLREVLPPIYRFGTGDITDRSSKRSGQIDIVIEMPWAPSFPMLVGSGARLYPAEAVGTAIEVKSNLISQWNDVIRTASKLAPLRQRLGGIAVGDEGLEILNPTVEPIPLYAVGFDGWSTEAIVKKKLRATPVDGVLVLKHKIFSWSDRRAFIQRLKRSEEELEKKRAGPICDRTLATCARLNELIQRGVPSGEIVSTLNTEQCAVDRMHFGDGEFLPTVGVGGWTIENLQDVCKVFLQKTKVKMGIEAILEFIEVVHREVGKRAGMSGNLAAYAE